MACDYVPNYSSMDSSYSSALKAFHEFSNERITGLACLQQQIPTALEKLQLGKEKATFNILSIGAGDGFMDQEILKFVQEGYLRVQDKEVSRILNTAIEPNGEFLGQYKKSIERRSDKDNGKVHVDFDLKRMAVEEYVGQHDPNQYELIHAIHSLYYIDVESTLKHCYYNKLGQKGLILCLIGNDSDLATRACKILDKYHPEFECQRRPRGNPAANVMHIAEKNSMMYEKVEAPFSVDVTSVLDESSLEGRYLLDFIAQEDNYRQTADQEELAEVLQMLRDNSIEDNRGRLIVKGCNELIMIYKTP